MSKAPEPIDEDAKRLYQQSVLQQSLEYDKQLLWLAGGAIALVAALVTTLKPTLAGPPLFALGTGLLLLVGSLATTLASFQVSIADSGAILRGVKEEDRTRRERRMRLLNIISLSLLVAGVVVFSLFTYLVLPKEGGTMAPKVTKPGNGMPPSVPTQPSKPSPGQATPRPAPTPKK